MRRTMVLGGWLLACQPGGQERPVEALVCSELGGKADPLQLTFSDDPAANGRIGAFVASARGLYDAAEEMERMAVDACRRMAGDLGAGPAGADSGPASVQKSCAPVLQSIERLAASGVDMRVAVAEPRCERAQARGSQCSSACGSPGPECQALCDAQAAVYGECSFPSVAVAVSSDGAEATKLAASVERNLPTLLYAELALGQRLFAHSTALVAVAGRLPADLQSAGVRGVACTGLAASVITKSAARMQGVLAASSTLTQRLRSGSAP